MRKISLEELKGGGEFSLVLSGGGAFGIAHLGVIGSSLAIGMSESEIFEEVKRFSRVGKWIQLSLNGNSILINSTNYRLIAL